MTSNKSRSRSPNGRFRKSSSASQETGGAKKWTPDVLGKGVDRKPPMATGTLKSPGKNPNSNSGHKQNVLYPLSVEHLTIPSAYTKDDGILSEVLLSAGTIHDRIEKLAMDIREWYGNETIEILEDMMDYRT